MSSSSEEKNHPASQKKLRDARKKGQLAKSADLVAAITTAAMVGYVWAGSAWIVRTLQSPFLLVEQALPLGFDAAARSLLPAAATAAALVVVPALVIAVVSAAAANLLTNGGFLLTLEPLMPKLSTLDPIKGLGKLFALKNMVELVKSVIKAAVFGAAMFLVARSALNPLLRAPVCGVRCFGTLLEQVLRPLVMTGLGVYAVAGLADLFMQKWLFAREMRMTTTEVKRERKDQDGNPQIKGAIRRQQRESAQGGPKLGFHRATLLICGPGQVVGLRYVRGETDFPLVVCRAAGARADEFVADGRARALPVFWDEDLAGRMLAKLQLGRPITAEFFQRVAQVLYASGAVR